MPVIAATMRGDSSNGNIKGNLVRGAEVYRKIKLSPPIREILTSKADRAVMAVTIERDSWRVAFAFAIRALEDRFASAAPEKLS